MEQPRQSGGGPGADLTDESAGLRRRLPIFPPTHVGGYPFFLPAGSRQCSRLETRAAHGI